MSFIKRLGRLTTGAALGLALAAGSANAQSNTINIGWTGPLSGGAALYGKNTLNGIEMAVDEINAKGGIEVNGKKYKFNVVALDDKYSPAEAAVNARRLVQQEQTPVVFVPHFGGTAALQAFNESMNFIIIAHTSVPSVTERGNKLTIRTPPPFSIYMEPFSKITMERYGKRLGIAAGNHDYAKAWLALAVPAWKELGGEVVAENLMDYTKDADYYSGVSKVLAAKPDVLFVGGPSEPTALVIKQARELGFKGGFITMDQPKFDEMAAVLGGYELMEGAVGTTPLQFYGSDATDSYVKRYQKLHKEAPSAEAGLNYFATYMIAEAMKLAGNVTDAKAIRAKVAEALADMPSEYNLYEVQGIDDGGALKSILTVATIKDGKVVPVRAERLD
jgi:branched-chain amino acid transport system substrate-binding protein